MQLSHGEVDQLFKILSECGSRLLRIEARIRILQRMLKSQSRRSDLLSASLSPIISGVILAIFGFFLTGKFDRALQERQVQVTSGKEMQEVAGKMWNGTSPEATALVLAGFGRDALPTLVTALRSSPDVQVAAEHGLEATLLTDRDSVCHTLVIVLDSKTGLYGPFAKGAALRVIGEGQCVEAGSSVRSYLTFLRTAAPSFADPNGVSCDPEGLKKFKAKAGGGTCETVHEQIRDACSAIEKLNLSVEEKFGCKTTK